MDKDIKFSIIMPVFNVEKYIRKSLESLVNQTYKNLEIICVNDKSTDSSLAILQEYSSKDSRFVIIDQEENKGPGAARNTAIEKATGDYISFVDSDDWMELDAFEQIVEALKGYNYPKILQFDFKEVYENSDLVRYYDFCGKVKRKDKYDIRKNNYYNWKVFKEKFFARIIPACWNRVYSREFLLENNVKFTCDDYGEDSAFTYRALLRDVNIYYLNKYLYNYYKRNTLGRYSVGKRLASLDYLKILSAHVENNIELKKYLKGAIAGYRLGVIKARVMLMCNTKDDIKEKLAMYDEILSIEEQNELLNILEKTYICKKIYSVKKEKVNGKRLFVITILGKTFYLGKRD